MPQALPLRSVAWIATPSGQTGHAAANAFAEFTPAGQARATTRIEPVAGEGVISGVGSRPPSNPKRLSKIAIKRTILNLPYRLSFRRPLTSSGWSSHLADGCPLQGLTTT